MRLKLTVHRTSHPSPATFATLWRRRAIVATHATSGTRDLDANVSLIAPADIISSRAQSRAHHRGPLYTELRANGYAVRVGRSR